MSRAAAVFPLLVVVERVHRGTVVPQPASVLGSLVGMAVGPLAGAGVLLRGTAVTGAVRRRPGPGPAVGAHTGLAAPDHAAFVELLLARGCAVHVAREDCERLGVRLADAVPGVLPVDPDEVAALVEGAQRVWFL